MTPVDPAAVGGTIAGIAAGGILFGAMVAYFAIPRIRRWLDRSKDKAKVYVASSPALGPEDPVEGPGAELEHGQQEWEREELRRLKEEAQARGEAAARPGLGWLEDEGDEGEEGLGYPEVDDTGHRGRTAPFKLPPIANATQAASRSPTGGRNSRPRTAGGGGGVGGGGRPTTASPTRRAAGREPDPFDLDGGDGGSYASLAPAPASASASASASAARRSKPRPQSALPPTQGRPGAARSHSGTPGSSTWESPPRHRPRPHTAVADASTSTGADTGLPAGAGWGFSTSTATETPLTAWASRPRRPRSSNPYGARWATPARSPAAPVTPAPAPVEAMMEDVRWVPGTPVTQAELSRFFDDVEAALFQPAALPARPARPAPDLGNLLHRVSGQPRGPPPRGLRQMASVTSHAPSALTAASVATVSTVASSGAAPWAVPAAQVLQAQTVGHGSTATWEEEADEAEGMVDLLWMLMVD